MRVDALRVGLMALLLMLAGCTAPDAPSDATTEDPAEDPGTEQATGAQAAAEHSECAEYLETEPYDKAEEPRNPDNPIWVLETNCGTMKLELFLDDTPITSGNIINLTNEGYFDGQRSHRIIANFMMQAGDPLTKDEENQARWGTGGPGYTIPDEFVCEDGTVVGHPGSYQQPADLCDDHGGYKFSHDGPGALSMANTGSPNTGGSQFFITFTATQRLDGYHPVFGQLVEGFNVLSAIETVSTDSRDRPTEDVFILQATIE